MVAVDKQIIDRITLNPTNRNKLDQWLVELESQLNGIVKITRTDLVNCLIELHSNQLSDTEIKAAAKYCFDEVRWLTSAMERLKKAKKAGTTVEKKLAKLKEKSDNAKKEVSAKPKRARLHDFINSLPDC